MPEKAASHIDLDTFERLLTAPTLKGRDPRKVSNKELDPKDPKHVRVLDALDDLSEGCFHTRFDTKAATPGGFLVLVCLVGLLMWWFGDDVPGFLVPAFAAAFALGIADTAVGARHQHVHGETVAVALLPAVLELPIAEGSPEKKVFTDLRLAEGRINKGMSEPRIRELADDSLRHLDLPHEVSQVMTRCAEVASVRRELGDPPPKESRAYPVWSAAATAIDRTVAGLEDRVEALEHYADRLDQLRTQLEDAARIEKIHGLTDRITDLGAATAADTPALSHLDSTTDEVASLQEALRETQDRLGADVESIRAISIDPLPRTE